MAILSWWVMCWKNKNTCMTVMDSCNVPWRKICVGFSRLNAEWNSYANPTKWNLVATHQRSDFFYLQWTNHRWCHINIEHLMQYMRNDMYPNKPQHWALLMHFSGTCVVGWQDCLSTCSFSYRPFLMVCIIISCCVQETVSGGSNKKMHNTSNPNFSHPLTLAIM